MPTKEELLTEEQKRLLEQQLADANEQQEGNQPPANSNVGMPAATENAEGQLKSETDRKSVV